MTSIRTARVELALALMQQDPDRLHEANALLRQALQEHGDEPPDWWIHLQLGTLADHAGEDRVQVLSAVLDAAIASPVAAEEPARVALNLLEGPAAQRWVSRLDPSQVDSVISHARSDPASASLVQLAVQLSFLRGDAAAGGALLHSTSDPSVHADPAIGAARAVARALELVDDGQFPAALAVLDESDVTDGDTAATSARALALYGAGRLDDALELAAAAPPTFEAAAAQALVWLYHAANRTTKSLDHDPVAEADRAASTAARLEPSLGDGLLLRAQVALEGQLDLEGGRQLLQGAIAKLDGMPEGARPWRLQRRVRDDEMFRYMSLEVAVACERDDELLGVALDEFPFSRTAYRQDAALAEQIAAANERAGRIDIAAEFFEAAARYYASATEPDLALAPRRSASILRPSVQGLIELAEEQWTASFRAEDRGDDAMRRTIDAGLGALDRLDASGLDQQPADQVQAAYMRGLLLARRATQRSATLRERWLPLPWLLLAALADPLDAYRSAHLSWALDTARLARPALHFAERAFALDENDDWLKEGLAVMHLNWHGLLDDRMRALVGELGYEDWAAALRTVDALDRQDLATVRVEVEQATLDALWAREIRAQAVTILDGIGAASELWEAVLEESTREPTAYSLAANAALALEDAASARRYVEDGLTAGVISVPGARLLNALADILERSDEASLDELRIEIRDAVRPFLVRGWACRYYPVLARTWAHHDHAAQALDTLQRDAENRMGELPDHSPPLTIETDRPEITSTDEALDVVVREMLRIEERSGLGSDPGSIERLQRLVAATALSQSFELALTAAAPGG